MLRRPRLANFAHIIKTVTIFIKTTFKTKNLKSCIKMQSIYVFLDKTKVDDFQY